MGMAITNGTTREKMLQNVESLVICRLSKYKLRQANEMRKSRAANNLLAYNFSFLKQSKELMMKPCMAPSSITVSSRLGMKKQS